MSVRLARGAALALAALASTAATAQPAYTPQPGQPGKDVIWVATPQAVVDTMLDMAKVTAADFVIDLGSGDGRTVISAAKRGARALGIEYNPDLVEFSKAAAQKEGVAGRASFVQADLFESDFSGATVITMYLLPKINLKLRPKILSLKPGTRVVSHSFDMGEWKPDETILVDQWASAFLWIVPAQVAGTYRLAEGELSLKQEFQVLSGTLRSAAETLPVSGRVRGDTASLRAGSRIYRARLNGTGLRFD